MIFISHRGNLSGIDEKRENSPSYIDEAIKKGFDVEIDIRHKGGTLWLGHDNPQYSTTLEWLAARKEHLWLHIKDYQSLIEIKKNDHLGLQYFCHQSDEFTLVSSGHIWCHNINEEMNNFCIIPLLSLEDVLGYNQSSFYAVCSDYVIECREKFNEKTYSLHRVGG